jgi:hypothetical protein
MQRPVDRNIWQQPERVEELGQRPVPVITSTRNDDSPQFSPDGKKIVLLLAPATGFGYVIEMAKSVQLTSFDIMDRYTALGPGRTADCI